MAELQDDDVEGPLVLVKAAILAANPHNTQPWLFQVTESHIEVFADISRHLGAMDVYMREMHIGLGCAVENMLLAAKAYGYETQLALSPGILSELPQQLWIYSDLKSIITPILLRSISQYTTKKISPRTRD